MTAPTLAMERTALAWRRTSLGAAACALLFVHEASADGGPTWPIPLAAATVALLLAGVGWSRGRALSRGHCGTAHRFVATTTLAVATVSLIAAVTVLLNG
ncbi:DUF202 domain-containing protein [Nocardia sp. NPDC060249]|uniref:DUF202 domain-containing protein n=1 Tax=Nocardia sp. NPDC060249 TaxID=3347082 RepID=UPI00364E0766